MCNETRFLKSAWAANVAKEAGFEVKVGSKETYHSGSFEPFLVEKGFWVKASKKELKNLGLISSEIARYV